MSRAFEGSLNLRRRSQWEAMDAGILLWRENFAYLLIFFAIPYWTCAFALRLVPENLIYLSWLGLWLLRPLFDRFILHVISIRFFERTAGLKRLAKGLGKTLLRGLFADLSWRRFSPLRPAMLPVRTLEGLSIKRTRLRRQILKKGGLGFCFMLTCWALLLEVFLLGGEIGFCYIMGELLEKDFLTMLRDAGFIEIAIFTAWCVNGMLIESLFVCMGFSIYLNSRVEVEGWDLEIMFKGFASKKHQRRKPVIHIAIIFCVLALCLPITGTAQNEEINHEVSRSIMPGSENDVPLETLKNILDSPDFGGEKDGWEIVRKKPKEEKEKKTSPFKFPKEFEKIRQVIALVLRTILVLAIATVVILLLLFLRKKISERTPRQKGPAMRAFEKTQLESPESLLVKSKSFFEKGDIRQAWGFCVAAIFRTLSIYRNANFPLDATEYECLELVRAANIAESTSIAVPVKHWTAFAYAGRTPPQGSFEEAYNYCKGLKETDK